METEHFTFKDFRPRRPSQAAEAVSFDGHVFGVFYDNPLTGFQSKRIRCAFQTLPLAEVRTLRSGQEIWVHCQVKPYDQLTKRKKLCWGFFVGSADWFERRGNEAVVWWQCGRWKPASLVQDICQPKSESELLVAIRENPRALQVYPDGEDQGRGRTFLGWVGPRASWFPPDKRD